MAKMLCGACATSWDRPKEWRSRQVGQIAVAKRRKSLGAMMAQGGVDLKMVTWRYQGRAANTRAYLATRSIPWQEMLGARRGSRHDGDWRSLQLGPARPAQLLGAYGTSRALRKAKACGVEDARSATEDAALVRSWQSAQLEVILAQKAGACAEPEGLSRRSTASRQSRTGGKSGANGRR